MLQNVGHTFIILAVLVLYFHLPCASSKAIIQEDMEAPVNNNRLYRSDASSSDKKKICEECTKNRDNTPLYCPIKPNLPQCIHTPCPKFCEDPGGDPEKRYNLKSKGVANIVVNKKAAPPPPPVGIPKAPKDDSQPPKETARGRSYRVEAPGEEKFTVYDPHYCDFQSPHLKRIRPGSKYIEYRPENRNYQVKDIWENAEKYGLVLAEIRTPREWRSVQSSSVLDTVSTYKNTEEEPRIYYTFGFTDKGKTATDHGHFIHPTCHKSSVAFVVMDPSVYGRVTEQCGVLSHVQGSDQKNYLSARLWNCENFMGKQAISYGLFMFPPDSMCYHKSEEECESLKQSKLSIEKPFNLIEVGQTVRRFIYFFSDQRSWSDAKALCEANGLKLLDLDPKWGDAIEVEAVIERFLRAAKLSPSTMMWTSGKFDNGWSDGKFKWVTTGSEFDTKYPKEPPPFPFAWWDDQKKQEGARRPNIQMPCVSMALNPEDGGPRPKLNFKTWYCDFPMHPICYRGFPAVRLKSVSIPPPTFGKRRKSTPESCEKAPVRPPPPVEEIDPVDESTCSTKSPHLKQLALNSKFYDYQPPITSYSVEQIKEQCKKYGLIPGEIRTAEDWDTVRKSGIGGIVTSDSDATGSGTDYFYVIGMDDSTTAGQVRNNDDGSKLTYSMFSPEGSTNISDRCAMLDSATAPDKTRGLMMLYVNCKEGKSDQKVAYGLCMYPRGWKCYTESKEEMDANSDPEKATTIIDLGATVSRGIFYNPLQRNWEGAKKFCESAGLKLLDFDDKWGDSAEVQKIFMDKIVGDGGLFQLTPIWTSGKLEGQYDASSGKWETTKTSLQFPSGNGFRWLRVKDPNLSMIREGTITNACVEASFNDVNSFVRFRPDYCDVPKYFLCYRKNKRRKNDPPPMNHLGITVIDGL